MDTSLRSLLVFIILLPVFTVWISTLVWVYRDAERCGKPGILVALMIGVLFWPLGLLVWLILRQDYLAETLPPAAVPPLAPPGACPQCGQAMAPGTVHGLCPACLLRQAAFESVAPGPGLAGFTPPAATELAELFPQFESLELLGRGGMGAVYKARQTSLDRFVALKILPVEADEDPAFGERFQREARALAQLSHPNIVGVHDYGQTGGFAYLVMEYVDGANLRQLQRAGRLSPREAMAIVPQICEALQFAHDHGIVHRDIKPENILIDTHGRVKIADFGLAKLLRSDSSGPALTLSRHAVGTPQYMAPEQIEKPETVDHRADIYSLGVVFYEMLTGELPIGRFAAPSGKVQIDVRLDEVVLKALEKEPALRYQQASAFKTNVETVAGVTAVASVSGTDDPPTATPSAYQQPAAHAGIAAPVAAPDQAQGANQMPSAQPKPQKRSGCWLLLAVLLVVSSLVGIALPAVSKIPVQVWWLLPLVVIAGSIAGYVWAFKRPGPRMAGLGAGFWGASVLTFAGFLAQMMHVFDRIAQKERALDAEGLASGIQAAQLTGLLAFAFFVLGAIFVSLALFKYRYRARWFHRVLVTAGILMLFAYPIGTVLGALLLFYLLSKEA